MSRRYFANTATQQTLQSSISSSDTSLTINGSFSGWPTQFPFFATLDIGKTAVEVISVTAITGSTATIVRGEGGTAALGHLAGATIDHTVVAADLDEPNSHVNSDAGVHGVIGSVVGTTDAQTLTNKTLTSPTLSGPTVTGTLAAANVTASGTLAVAGGTTVGGTLGVTGKLTTTTDVAVGGSLSVNGVKPLKQASFTVHMATAQGVANNSAQTLKFDTVDEDNFSCYNSSAGSYTIPTGQGGRWIITASLSWAPNATGQRALQLVSGVTISSWAWVPAATDSAGRLSASWVGRLPDGAIVACNGYQTSGGSLNTGTGLNGTYFSGQRLGN